MLNEDLLVWLGQQRHQALTAAEFESIAGAAYERGRAEAFYDVIRYLETR